ncbi:hypothetical protein BASA83_012217 [Batrachochytrium salamandrivorans]|nr:hypothetical protein BASA83_012217 [Batrachochytrium salamandrivorans]
MPIHKQSPLHIQPQSSASSTANVAASSSLPDQNEQQSKKNSTRDDIPHITLHAINPNLHPATCIPLSFTGASTPVDLFEKVGRVGQGTYGIVYKARHRITKATVALKRVRMDQEQEGGMPISSLREVSLLRSLNHMNVVRVVDVAVGAAMEDLFLVMEYCEQDMANIMDSASARGRKVIYQPAEVKCLVQQLLNGVAYLHKNFVIHRDLKLSNLLLTAEGILKIADFGLARLFSEPLEPMTPRVVTLWYRSPELLLGTKNYSTSADMWSVGCILGEFLKSEPLLPGRIERHQLDLICELLGSPTKNIWPEITSMPFYKAFRFPRIEYDSVRVSLRDVSNGALRLVKALLVWRPSGRISAADALCHEYFSESPHACSPLFLPSFPELRNVGHVQQQQQAATAAATKQADGCSLVIKSTDTV